MSRVLLVLPLAVGLFGCGGTTGPSTTTAKAGAHQVRVKPEQPASSGSESGGNLRLCEVATSKGPPGRTAIDVFVVNQGKEPIVVYRAPGLPHIDLAVQIKHPDGQVFRLIDAYPRMDIARFAKHFVRLGPGEELKFCSFEIASATKFRGTWMGDRGDGTENLSFATKGKYQLWFAYGGGSPFVYTRGSRGEFANLKHCQQFGPVMIEVELR